MADKMLAGGHHPTLFQALALQAAHVGHAKLADQGGVFAEGFLQAAPARVARHIQHGCQALVRAHRPHLLADDFCHDSRQLGLEGSSQPDHLRESRAPQGHITRTAFLMNDGRNAEPGFIY